MVNVSKNDTGTRNVIGIWKIRFLVVDMVGPQGQPWTDLLGNPLNLRWNISHGNDVLGAGKVDPEGWIIARLFADYSTFTLRIGPASKEGPLFTDPEKGFEWCETYILQLEADDSDQKKHVRSLNQLGYHTRVSKNSSALTEKAAVIHFQRENKLKITGELGDGQSDKVIENKLKELINKANEKTSQAK